MRNAGPTHHGKHSPAELALVSLNTFSNVQTGRSWRARLRAPVAKAMPGGRPQADTPRSMLNFLCSKRPMFQQKDQGSGLAGGSRIPENLDWPPPVVDKSSIVLRLRNSPVSKSTQGRTFQRVLRDMGRTNQALGIFQAMSCRAASRSSNSSRSAIRSPS